MAHARRTRVYHVLRGRVIERIVVAGAHQGKIVGTSLQVGSRFHLLIGASGRARPARRRDADGSGRDDRATHPQLHRSG